MPELSRFKLKFLVLQLFIFSIVLYQQIVLAADIQAAKQAWAMAEKLLQDAQYDMLVFDEIGYMFKYGYLEVEPIVAALTNRPKMQNVIMTGRTMATELQEVADTISIVQDERHAFRQGVKAQQGIEY